MGQIESARQKELIGTTNLSGGFVRFTYAEYTGNGSDVAGLYKKDKYKSGELHAADYFSPAGIGFLGLTHITKYVGG